MVMKFRDDTDTMVAVYKGGYCDYHQYTCIRDLECVASLEPKTNVYCSISNSIAFDNMLTYVLEHITKLEYIDTTIIEDKHLEFACEPEFETARALAFVKGAVKSNKQLSRSWLTWLNQEMKALNKTTN